MFDCQWTVKDGGQRRRPAYIRLLGTQEQCQPTNDRRGWISWIPLVCGLAASAADVGLAWCARTAWLQWWDVPRRSELTADGSSTSESNETAEAGHYKYTATRSLLHDSHLPLAESHTTHPQTNLHALIAHWVTGIRPQCWLWTVIPASVFTVTYKEKERKSAIHLC